MTNRYPTGGAARKVIPDYPRALPRVPANDNVPLPKRSPLPIPANDNIPHGPLGSPRVAPRWYGAPLAGRIAGRLLPILGWAMLAWELYELWRWWQSQAEPEWSGSGVCVPVSGFRNPQYPTDRYTWRGTSACGANPGPAGSYTVGAFPPYKSNYPFLFLRHLAYTSTNQHQDHRWWYYPSPPTGPLPTFENPFPVGDPVPVPIAPPALPELPPGKPYWWDPMLNPPLAPMAPPNSVPPVRWRPPPAERPETSSRGNYAPGHASPAPDLGPSPLPSRPPARTKERKIGGRKGSWFRKYGGALLSHASEAGDLVDALHDALPDKYQSDGNMADRLRALYEHSDEIDFDEAVRNIWQNHQEDRIWGQGFGKIQDMFDEYGIDLGSLRL